MSLKTRRVRFEVTGREPLRLPDGSEVNALVTETKNSYASYTFHLSKESAPHILRLEVRGRAGWTLVYELE